MLVQSMHDRATPQRKNIVHAHWGHHLRPGPPPGVRIQHICYSITGGGARVQHARGGGKDNARCSFCSDALYDGVRYGSKYNPSSWSGPATAHNSTRDGGGGFKGP
jgi:hypothetical protein